MRTDLVANFGVEPQRPKVPAPQSRASMPIEGDGVNQALRDLTATTLPMRRRAVTGRPCRLPPLGTPSALVVMGAPDSEDSSKLDATIEAAEQVDHGPHDHER